MQGAGDPRPIEHFGSELIFADHLRASLGTGPSSGVFRYADTLALLRSITEAGYVKPTTPEALTEPENLVQLNGDRLSCYLQEQIFYTRPNVKGEIVRAYPPIRPVKEVVSLPSSAVSARITTGVTRTPSIRIDGSILDRAGYDPERLCAPTPLEHRDDDAERGEHRQQVAHGGLDRHEQGAEHDHQQHDRQPDHDDAERQQCGIQP